MQLIDRTPLAETAHETPRKLRWSVRTRYLTALALVGLLSVGAFVALSSVIQTQGHYGTIINVSGRQRMLSQRTALYAQMLASTQNPGEREALAQTLARDTDLMERSHVGLTEGDEELGLPGNPSPAVAALYFGAPTDLDAQVREHISRVRSLLAAPESDLTPDNPDLQAILATAPTTLLPALNDVVTQYEAESSAQVARLKWVEIGVLLATLLTLVLEAVFIFHPMERAIRSSRQKLVHDAFHDDLTGVPNRALFVRRLSRAIGKRQESERAYFAVVFLDLDRFKTINDSLGHSVGDALLAAFCERLLRCVRPGDTVARLAGDEFTVLLEDMSSPEDALSVAERIERALEAPFSLAGHSVHATASLGIVSSEEGYTTAEEVLRDADIAMYRAKVGGRAQHQLFSPEMREEVVQAMVFERDLRSAVPKGELEVHYQPIVSVAAAETVGFEALVRWRHAQRGLVSPADFIPIAEETGVIVDIDRWVLRQACAQLVIWQAQFANPLTLNVNLTSQQLERPDFVEVVRKTLAETGFEAAQLHLEITESTLVNRTEEVIAALGQLESLGVELHIDDFGTGYSSLSYLQGFPADALKIDRSFVNKLTQNAESARLVQTIVAMAHGLGLRVVAEGVETVEQLEHLRGLGCEYAQGFYFAKPLETDAVAEFLTLSSKERADKAAA